jgi:hypothetical protein
MSLVGSGVGVQRVDCYAGRGGGLVDIEGFGK